MKWRPICAFYARTRCCAVAESIDPHRRFISKCNALRVSYPNIASLLTHQRLSDDHESQHVVVTGFVRTVRNQKLRSFVEIGDGSTVKSLQAVLEPHQARG